MVCPTDALKGFTFVLLKHYLCLVSGINAKYSALSSTVCLFINLESLYGKCNCICFLCLLLIYCPSPPTVFLPKTFFLSCSNASFTFKLVFSCGVKCYLFVCDFRLLIYPIASSNGEGNGNPLQYSCRENPMDGRAW